MRPLLTALLALICAGCASVDNRDVQPTTDKATIVSQMSRSEADSTVWNAFVPFSVDNVHVKRPYGRPYETVAIVDPGERRVVVDARFNTGRSADGPFDAIVLVVAVVQAGKVYRLNGRVQDDNYLVWLEDAKTGQKASAEGSAKWRRTPSGGTVIPILVPVR